MSEQQADRLLDLINKLIARDSYNDSVNIDISSTDFTLEAGFFLYVGVTGRVVGINIHGNPVDAVFIAGYHRIKMKQVTKTNTAATNMMALW